MLRERVEKTLYKHYSYLETLTRRNPPEEIVRRSIRKSIKIMPVRQEVNIYLIIGFFSADGFTINVQEKPVIGIGLERMQNFSNIDIITAHEYAHFIRNLYGLKSMNQFEETINEGIATVFSKRVLPQKPLPKHLFLSNAEFNRLLQMKDKIIDRFNETKGIKFLEKIGEGKRVKNFIGYFIVRRYLEGKKDWTLDELFKEDSRIF